MKGVTEEEGVEHIFVLRISSNVLLIVVSDRQKANFPVSSLLELRVILNITCKNKK